MTDTLQLTTHNTTTDFSISIEEYFPTFPPYQVSGLCNEEGFTIWVIISATLLNIMRDEGFGLDALSCLSQLTLVITRFVFVDDTDTINTAKSVHTTGEDLLKKTTKCIRYLGMYIMNNMRSITIIYILLIHD